MFANFSGHLSFTSPVDIVQKGADKEGKLNRKGSLFNDAVKLSVNATKDGSTYPRCKMGSFGQIEIFLFPLETQHAISGTSTATHTLIKSY